MSRTAADRKPLPDPSLVGVQTLAQVEWEHIVRVVNDCNITHAAEALGAHRYTLQRKITKHGPGVLRAGRIRRSPTYSQAAAQL